MKILNIEPLGYSSRAREILEAVGDYHEVVEDHHIQHHRLDTECLIVRLKRKIDNSFIDQFPRLRLIVTATTGLDHIDIESIRDREIEVLSLRGETEFLSRIPSTAEHTWALLMALVRRIPAAHQSVLGGNWDRDAFRGQQLRGKTLCIIGLGRTGSLVASYGTAFGMGIHYYDPFVESSVYQRCDTMEDLLSSANFVSVHIHLSNHTEGVLDEKALSRIPMGSYLVNTSRGRLIDENALARCVESGQFAGVAVDVLSTELSSPFESPLWKLSSTGHNVIITPHIGGATVDAMYATEEFMAHKLVAHLNPNYR